METFELLNHQNNTEIDSYENILYDMKILNNNVEKNDFAEKSIVKAINVSLEHAATHCQGLNLICKFLPNISNENLVKYFFHWIAKVIQILTNSHDSQELMIACKTIEILIKTCKKIGELDKRISTYNVKQISGIIINRCNQQKHEALLNLIVVLLYYYPESCARFQASFSKIISSCVDDTSHNIVISGAKCYSLLVRAVERSFTQLYKTNPAIKIDNINCHIFHQITLCNNLYTLIDEMFHDLIITASEFPYNFQRTGDLDILQLSKIPCCDLFKYYTMMENRFANICKYLSMLLNVGAKEGKKFVLPNIILDVVCKGLAITLVNLQKNNSVDEKKILSLILPKLHMSLLKVLHTLIMSFWQELVPFSMTILRLLLQILEWTSKFSSESIKNIKIFTYKILSVWSKQTGTLSGFQLIADEFLQYILCDLSPPRQNIVNLTTKSNENTEKADSKNEELRQNNLNNCSYNKEFACHKTDFALCSQVLVAVQAIILNINPYLKQTFCEKIRKNVILFLYEIYVKNVSLSTNKINVEYRLQLLKALHSLQTCTAPNSTSYAIQIFGLVISLEKDPKLIEEAILGLSELRHIVYPSAPTMMLPVAKETNTNFCTRLSSSQLLNVNDQDNDSQSESMQQILDYESELNELSKRPRLDENRTEAKEN